VLTFQGFIFLIQNEQLMQKRRKREVVVFRTIIREKGTHFSHRLTSKFPQAFISMEKKKPCKKWNAMLPYVFGEKVKYMGFFPIEWVFDFCLGVLQ